MSGCFPSDSVGEMKIDHQNTYDENEKCTCNGWMKCDKCNAKILDFNDMEYIKNRLDKLEKENLMRQDTIACIDRAYDESHIEIEKRLDKLEEYIREVKLLYSNPLQQEVWQENITKRLEKLESNNFAKQLDLNVWKLILGKVDELEKSILETRIQFIEQIGNDKTPHRCPVCDGKRLDFSNPIPGTGGLKWDICLICEGKGIVWG